MIFFQFVTNGVLFKPVNLTNIILQNSYIIVMALGMLLVIVAGHIDLSVGSVSGFIGALAAMLMVGWKFPPELAFLANPFLAGAICLVVGAIVGAAQGYIIVAPNRRGMPGHGVEWNEQISKDWGGKPLEDLQQGLKAALAWRDAKFAQN